MWSDGYEHNVVLNINITSWLSIWWCTYRYFPVIIDARGLCSGACLQAFLHQPHRGSHPLRAKYQFILLQYPLLMVHPHSVWRGTCTSMAKQNLTHDAFCIVLVKRAYPHGCNFYRCLCSTHNNVMMLDIMLYIYICNEIVRGVPNKKPNSSAVWSMATKGNEITLYIKTKLLAWPHKESQFCYLFRFLHEKQNVKDTQWSHNVLADRVSLFKRMYKKGWHFWPKRHTIIVYLLHYPTLHILSIRLTVNLHGGTKAVQS